MEDKQIVHLYLMRNEEAILQSQKKYGTFLRSVAFGVLQSPEDSAECENDTYYTAWNKIPPDSPLYLGCYLSKIVRFIALNRLSKKAAGKRRGENIPLHELCECIPQGPTVEEQMEQGALRESLNRFLYTLPSLQRRIFLKRYFSMESIADIARDCALSEGNVKTILFRVRGRLKSILEKEGFL